MHLLEAIKIAGFYQFLAKSSAFKLHTPGCWNNNWFLPSYTEFVQLLQHWQSWWQDFLPGGPYTSSLLTLVRVSWHFVIFVLITLHWNYFHVICCMLPACILLCFESNKHFWRWSWSRCPCFYHTQSVYQLNFVPWLWYTICDAMPLRHLAWICIGKSQKALMHHIH